VVGTGYFGLAFILKTGGFEHGKGNFGCVRGREFLDWLLRNMLLHGVISNKPVPPVRTRKK
jgi:hypothetical protein